MTETKITVRAAQRGDIDTLVDFNAAMAMETESKTLPHAMLHAGVSAVFDEPRRGSYRVAEIAGDIVGCLMVTFEWSDWRNGDWWWLQSVYVKPAYRRHGVFRAMYDDVELAATAATDVVGIRLYVETENRRAQSTYASLGMSEEHYRMFRKTLRADVKAALG